ncbi:YdaU family protein [Acinetobacter thermotolerans]|uniref:YdaU family protein n=1 Tax=Acinetobacter thermotolerans TaxID=3151487 RepID=UPI00325AD923
MHYYKRNLGDYAKKAGRLSMLEHGAYTLLIDAIYDREVFPTLDEALDWTWARDEAEVAAVKFVLNKFFEQDKDGRFVQNRIKEEIEAYRAKAENNARIAKEREENRRKKSGNTTNGEPNVHETCGNEHETPPNHKPLTINQEPVTNNIDSSSNTGEQNFSSFVPINFIQYQAGDRRRYTFMQCVNQYPLQNDFFDLAADRYADIPTQDLLTMLRAYGDFFSAKGDESVNTPSIWLQKWYSWIENNRDEVKRKREAANKPAPAVKPKSTGYQNQTAREAQEWMQELNQPEDPAMRDVHAVEGVGHA